MFDKHRLPPKIFSVGDLVLTKVTSFPANSESKKLLPKYRGPFKLVEVLPSDRYQVRKDIYSQRSSRPCEAVVGPLKDERLSGWPCGMRCTPTVCP
ncbi:unnamed protein product [Callosobruchus maculatus]|uniref:Uncharacterized protein n=1 Tax=Callosobruchus maculatus TaxID=64391 RepID=A0A653BFD7_CALMS|nr:unnamed protein product [Callosobruchus maculatus]